MEKIKINRRNFVTKAASYTIGAAGLGSLVPTVEARGNQEQPSLFFIGPMEGYSPQIGTIVSMLNYNRQTILDLVENMTIEELDYLHDPEANSIGALLLHLGAIEKFYQVNTFEGREFNENEQKVWGAAADLGDRGRNSIKGQSLTYYLDMITEVRNKTLSELKNRDDEWLLAIDPNWSDNGALNTYWKWFHVCEHEANHRGQITWLKKRLPK